MSTAHSNLRSCRMLSLWLCFLSRVTLSMRWGWRINATPFPGSASVKSYGSISSPESPRLCWQSPSGNGTVCVRCLRISVSILTASRGLKDGYRTWICIPAHAVAHQLFTEKRFELASARESELRFSYFIMFILLFLVHVTFWLFQTAFTDVLLHKYITANHINLHAELGII